MAGVLRRPRKRRASSFVAVPGPILTGQQTLFAIGIIQGVLGRTICGRSNVRLHRAEQIAELLHSVAHVGGQRLRVKKEY